MKTISIAVNNRPDCLRSVLASIRACPTWREWTLVFSLEPNQPTATHQLIAAVENKVVAENPHLIGCWENTFRAASLAMALKPSVNLYLEDDYLLTPDALTMVDQWANTIHGGVICLRRPHDTQALEQAEIVKPYQTGLFGCGFAWLEQDWRIVRKQWFMPRRELEYTMWDISMEELPLQQWRPMVNRSHGIGVKGTHTTHDGDKNLFGPAYDGKPITEFKFEQ